MKSESLYLGAELRALMYAEKRGRTLDHLEHRGLLRSWRLRGGEKRAERLKTGMNARRYKCA